MYKNFLKRVFDLFFSVLALVLLSPIFIVTAICVKIKLGSPIFFSQQRIGKDEKPFKMYKFRTMADEKHSANGINPTAEKHSINKEPSASDNNNSHSQRLTKFGILLRSSSLDELPQLVNIIKGDMSIVGPRPLLEEYLPFYTQREKLRHTVRPGLTIPSVLGDLYIESWDAQLEQDAKYVENIGFLYDAKIILATFSKLFKRNKEQHGGILRKKLSEERAK